MTTRYTAPNARHSRPCLLLVAGLLAMLAVGHVVFAASTAPCKEEAAMPSRVARAASAPAIPEPEAPAGLDLELRIGNLRIEFPWLKALPFRPGRHIVVRLFATS